MSELDITQIKKRSVRGILALIQRSFLLQIISAVSTFVLAYFLDTRVFGIFGVVNAFIGLLSYFSDIGLAAALIQKKEDLTKEDVATTFTIQQIMIGFIIIIGFSLTPLVTKMYSLDSSGVWLFWSLLFSFFLSSLKTIPSIILERKLEFQKLVIPQILETLVFNLVAVYCAWRGFGVFSFAVAVAARGIVGLIAVYIVQPWKIQIGISIPVAKHLFKFGIPFQSNSILALVKDDLLFVVMGKLLTLDQMGYIYLAKRLSELPLRTVMDNVMRVTFPAFSRLQHDTKTLVSALEKSIFGISLIVFPLYIGMLFFISPFMELVPKYQKWEPALVSFYFLCISSVLASLSTPLTNALNAVGKIKVTLGFMIMWIILTWFLVMVLIQTIGYHGFALALLLISTTVVVVVEVTKKYIPISFYSQVIFPCISALMMGIFFAYFVPRVPHTFVSLGLVGLLGVVLYSGIIWYSKKDAIYSLVAAFKRR